MRPYQPFEKWAELREFHGKVHPSVLLATIAWHSLETKSLYFLLLSVHCHGFLLIEICIGASTSYKGILTTKGQNNKCFRKVLRGDNIIYA